MKKIFLALTITSVLATSPGLVNAIEVDRQSTFKDAELKNVQKDITMSEEFVKYETPELMKRALKNQQHNTEGEINNDFYDNVTNEIDQNKLKQSLLEYYNSDPSTFSMQIKDIDNITKNAVLNNKKRNISSLNSKQSEVSPLAYIEIYRGWVVEPYLDSSDYRVKYSTGWLTEDNYRASVPLTVTSGTSITVNQSIGFTGSADIKSKLGFSYSNSVSQTATKSVGAQIPGWTVWGTRPYIRYTAEQYYGMYRVQYLDTLHNKTVTNDTVESGTRNVLRVQANEYWSRTNTAQSTSASTPSPPSGQPA